MLYENQMSRLQAPNGEESDTMSTSTSPSQTQLKDLDQLASEVRDPGRFPEPLADSVLAYSLRRFRPLDKAQVRTIQEVDHATSLRITELLEEDGGNPNIPDAASPPNQIGMQTMSVTEIGEGQSENSVLPIPSNSRSWLPPSQITVPQLPYWDWCNVNTDISQNLHNGPGELLDFHGEARIPDITWVDIMGEALQ